MRARASRPCRKNAFLPGSRVPDKKSASGPTNPLAKLFLAKILPAKILPAKIPLASFPWAGVPLFGSPRAVLMKISVSVPAHVPAQASVKMFAGPFGKIAGAATNMPSSEGMRLFLLPAGKEVAAVSTCAANGSAAAGRFAGAKPASVNMMLCLAKRAFMIFVFGNYLA